MEIHILGSKVLLEGMMHYFIRKGARLAQPGEFTQRAFLNGRISLSQAEAVLNIIHSSSEQEHRLAVNQLRQHSFQQLKEISQQLLDLVCQIELALDFSDQDVEIIPPRQINNSLGYIIASINKLVEGFSGHSVNTDGIICILCGRPNTGKSSLFNCLVQDRWNIVSPTPGTTRDYIEGKFSHKNTAFRVFDTAGIDKSSTEIPLPIRQADIYLLVIDASAGLTKQDHAVLKRFNPSKTILVANKIDLLRRNSVFPILRQRRTRLWRAHSATISCSALTGLGITGLKNTLAALTKASPPERFSDRSLINLHQQENLKDCLSYLIKAKRTCNIRYSYEIIALDIRQALDKLNSCLSSFSTGRNLVADDILNNIFSHFCIGK